MKSALRKVASVGLSVQQSTNSGREGYCTYKTLPVLMLAFSYQSSSTTAVSLSLSLCSKPTGNWPHPLVSDALDFRGNLGET